MLWDECAENAWDRRRWDNPSKTQNDEPHILGQLNLLYDIFARHNLKLNFPFPLWRKGGGAHAFEEPQVTNGFQVGQQQLADECPAPDIGISIDDRRMAHIDIAESCPSNNDWAMRKQLRAQRGTHVVMSDDSDDPEIMLDDSRVPRSDEPTELKIVQSSDEQEGDGDASTTPGGDPPRSTSSEPSASKKKMRELNRLAAWAWDSRKEEHPPNSDVYGVTTGKRARKSKVCDMKQLFESCGDDNEDGQRGVSETDSPLNSSNAWSSDDERPLFPGVDQTSGDKDDPRDRTCEPEIIPGSQESMW